MCVGGGGGRGYLNNQDQIINVGMIYAMQIRKIHRAECPNYGVSEMETTFKNTGNCCERRRSARLGL